MSEPENTKKKACALVRLLLDSDDCYLERVRELNSIGARIYGKFWDTEFHVFAEIASESYHLPTLKMRHLCSKDMLERADKELCELVTHYRKRVTSSCIEILELHENV